MAIRVEHSDVAGNGWRLWKNDDGTYGFEQAQLAVLMDLRDELQKLNRVFACPNALAIPSLLRSIMANTTKPKRKRKKQ